MDDVVADFGKYAKKVTKQALSPEWWTWEQPIWDAVFQNQRIFLNLEKTSIADELISFCRKFCLLNQYDLRFLTAIPKKVLVPWVFSDKITWARNYYPDIPVMFGPYSHQKKLHCNPADILIDDRPSNILDWNDAGGHGILYAGSLTSVKEQVIIKTK